MKHYRILSFVKIQNGIHRYDINNESGSYNCPTLHDTKVESDFCCEPNSYINSILCKSNDGNQYLHKAISIGMNIPIFNPVTEFLEEKKVVKIILKNSRGYIAFNNELENLIPINDIPNILRNSDNNMATAKAKNKTKVNAATISLSRSKAAAKPQSKEVEVVLETLSKDHKLYSLEQKLLKTENLRLAKFFKKNLPDNLKAFLKEFFKNYNNEHPTIYVTSKSEQTSVGRRRSLGDIFKICKYYYPDCNLQDVVTLLFTTLPKEVTNGFRCSYCHTIKKRVWYYDEGSKNYFEDNKDEYGNSVEYYK